MSKSNRMRVPFATLRRISSPEDLGAERVVMSGYAPANGVLEIPTDKNVRDYLAEPEGGKQRYRKSQVHDVILDTLINAPDDFSILNGGLVIIASSVDVDEKNKVMELESPSIVNGAQTQGVLREFYSEYEFDGTIHVRFELIILTDSKLVAEIAVSRNRQNNVQRASIGEALGYFTEISKVMKKAGYEVSGRESDHPDGDAVIPIEKLLQVITVLLPDHLIPVSREAAYSGRAECLKLFERTFKERRSDEVAAERYKFYIAAAVPAWELYRKWREHQGFSGSGLKKGVRRDANRKIIDVADGLVFPILAALARFSGPGGIKLPAQLTMVETELINSAKSAFMEIAGSNPNVMGKNKACYSYVGQVTRLIGMSLK